MRAAGLLMVGTIIWFCLAIGLIMPAVGYAQQASTNALPDTCAWQPVVRPALPAVHDWAWDQLED